MTSTRTKPTTPISIIEVIGMSLLVMIGISALGWMVFLRQFENHYYPGVTIDGISVAGLTRTEATEVLTQYHEAQLPQSTVVLRVDDIETASSASQLGLHRDYKTAVETAFEVGRARSGPQNWLDIFRAFYAKPSFSTQLSFDPKLVTQLVHELKARVDIEGQHPAAHLGSSGQAWSLEIEPGSVGREVVVSEAVDTVLENVSTNNISLDAPVASTAAVLNEAEQATAKERASQLIGSSLLFRADGVTITLADTDVIELLALPAGYSQPKIDEETSSWLESINRPPQDAVFTYEPDTLKVLEFKPDRPGLELQAADASALLHTKLAELEAQAIQAAGKEPDDQAPIALETDLPVAETHPTVPLASTNELGITELIGFGESYYDHSIPSRIHNVALTTERISNHIIKPGEEFSFNQALGEVSSRTGFKPAYVIKGGRTELGDGGGVCQVSTTLFRSVLNAGLPVTKRKPHSYRVSYYEQGFKPGIDATVYSGDVDLRFINDTDHHILISGQADSEDLYMTVELYGTSDGRSTEITDHITWGARGPLPTQYIDDPSLPKGVVKQIDWSAGGINASFKNIVKDKDGNVIREEEYVSNYRPWAAKFLRGV